MVPLPSARGSRTRGEGGRGDEAALCLGSAAAQKATNCEAALRLGRARWAPSKLAVLVPNQISPRMATGGAAGRPRRPCAGLATAAVQLPTFAQRSGCLPPRLQGRLDWPPARRVTGPSEGRFLGLAASPAAGGVAEARPRGLCRRVLADPVHGRLPSLGRRRPRPRPRCGDRCTPAPSRGPCIHVASRVGRKGPAGDAAGAASQALAAPTGGRAACSPVSKRSKASRISWRCSSVSSNFPPLRAPRALARRAAIGTEARTSRSGKGAFDNQELPTSRRQWGDSR